MSIFRRCRSGSLLLLSIPLFLLAPKAFAQQLEGRALYDALKKFELRGKASVSKFALKRDRVDMVFTGDFYFMAPVNGRVTGAVFIGEGTFHSEAPALPFEKENLTRFLNTDKIDTDFKQAVLRFTDNTFDLIGKGADSNAAAPAEAQSLAAEMEPRLLKEAGVNISSRLLLSLANNESPGVFLAQFDKGKLNRFTLLVDPQARIPSFTFGLNGGEKVLIFRYEAYSYQNDLWTATYSEEDFTKGTARFSDEFDIVTPLHYKMDIDLREPRRVLATKMRIDLVSSVDNLRVVSFVLNDGWTARDNFRQKYSMIAKSATCAGQDAGIAQEEWEIGLTLILPKAMKKDEKFSVDLEIAGESIDRQRTMENFYSPQAETSWYPRYGFLKRSTFDLTFRHRKNEPVASIGKLAKEGEWPDDKDTRLAQFVIDSPALFATFASGLLERHTQEAKLSSGLTLDFYSPPASVSNIKESFILNEMDNSINVFSTLFGPYSFSNFRATFHPSRSRQANSTLIWLPQMDEANRDTFLFIGRQTAYQWWGNLVTLRSHRDQWLADGFAEYSGMLFTKMRHGDYSMKEQLKTARFRLPFPPDTDLGKGSGKLAELAPLILGKRLQTRHTLRSSYETLIDNKGALVLRMLHYLFTDPGNPQNDKPFNDMLKEFVQAAGRTPITSENFIGFAGQKFAETPIAKKFGLKDLGWFFQQWVNEAKLPSYRLEYRIDSEGDKVFLSTKVVQENAGPDWFMPLPVKIKFKGGKEGYTMVYALGPMKEVRVELPMKPESVELDPDMWILSEKTSTKKM